MKYILLLAALLATNIKALTQQVEFIKSYATSGPNSEGEDIAILPDGGIMVATISLPEGTAYQEDILLIKTTTNGDTIWTKKFGATNNFERAEALIVLTNGNLLIAGNSGIVNGTQDALLICTDSAGNLLWQKTYGGAGGDFANAIKEVSDGIIMAGATSSFGAGSYDAWLLKTNATGDSLWSKTFGGAEYDDCWDIELTPEGGFMLTGGNYSFAAGQFDDAWLIKTTADGNMIWRKNYGLINRVDWAWALQPVTSGGNITGYVFVGVKNTEETMPGAANGDLHFVKVDTAGYVMWDNSIDGTNGSFRKEGMDIKQLSDGGFMIAGYQATNTARQLFAVRTDENGTVIWDTSFGNNQAYLSRALALSDDGSCYITGSLSTPLPSQHIFMVKIAGLPASTPRTLIQDKSLTIYPNPAGNTFHIKGPADADISTVELYSINGSLLRTITTNGSDDIEIDISALREPMLVVKIFTGSGISVQKLQRGY